MTRQLSRMMVVIACAGLVAGATGCKSVCRANKEAGLATIICQPMNQTVRTNATATFKVKAKGRNREYQWFFDDGDNRIALEDTKGFCGAHRSQLFVSNVGDDKVGYYSCQIISYDAEENPAITQTRMATLGFTTSSGRAQSVRTVDHQPMPPAQGSSGTSTCGVYRAYKLFDNNYAGYRPTAGQNTGFAKVRFSNTGNLPLSDYNLLWKIRNTTIKGCASDSDMGKTFQCDSANSYNFIVYFKNWPPPPGSGTNVILEINF